MISKSLTNTYRLLNDSLNSTFSSFEIVICVCVCVRVCFICEKFTQTTSAINLKLYSMAYFKFENSSMFSHTNCVSFVSSICIQQTPYEILKMRKCFDFQEDSFLVQIISNCANFYRMIIFFFSFFRATFIERKCICLLLLLIEMSSFSMYLVVIVVFLFSYNNIIYYLFIFLPKKFP